MHKRIPYVCGPLTDLPLQDQVSTKLFYVSIANALEKIHPGHRPFVPHEHFDPVIHAEFRPAQVYEAEAEQVCNRTSLLVVAALAPSWGGGMEVMMAHYNQVPIVLLKHNRLKVSRLLLGCPSVQKVIAYGAPEEGIGALADWYQARFAKAIPAA